MYEFEFRHVNGHIEVYKNGKFWGSYDTMSEAWKEVHDE